LQIAVVRENNEILKKFVDKFKDDLDFNLKATNSANPGVSALHLAAQGNYPEGIDILLEADAKTDVDQGDEIGCTPLFHAAYFKNSAAARCLIKNGAALNKLVPSDINKHQPTMLAYVLRKTPKAEEAIRNKLDDSVDVIEDMESNTISIKFYLANWQIENCRNLSLLHVVAKEGDSKLIEHPAMQFMLVESWKKAKILLYLRMLFGCVFLSFLTGYIYTEEPEKWLIYCLLTFAILDIVRKLFGLIAFARGPTANEFKKTFLDYIFSFDNYCQIMLIAGVFIFYFSTDDHLKKMIGPMVFLAGWFDLMILIGELPIFALYLDMYYSVIINFVKILLAFSIFLVGFVICFCMYFKTDENFSTWYRAIAKITVMTVGELDYSALIENYVKNQTESCTENCAEIKEDWYLIFPLVCVVVFLVAVPIVLMSLLVGQVINDISDIKSNALSLQLKRKANRTEYILSLWDQIISYTNAVLQYCNFDKIADPPIKEKASVPYSLDDDSLPDYLHNAFKISKQRNKR